MAFTRTEKLHLFIAKLSALPHPCVKRSFFFHRNIPFTYPKGGRENRPATEYFSRAIWQKPTIHDYSCQCAGRACLSWFLPLYSHWHFNELKNMEICYIEADVLERMLARAENLSAHVDRLYERNRCKEPGEWLDGQDVCLRLDISPRTLQTLRDTGRLAFTRLQRKFYYKPGDVEKLMVYVGIRRKEKEVRERRKNGNL